VQLHLLKGVLLIFEGYGVYPWDPQLYSVNSLVWYWLHIWVQGSVVLSAHFCLLSSLPCVIHHRYYNVSQRL